DDWPYQERRKWHYQGPIAAIEMGPIPGGVRHAPATRRKRTAARATDAGAEGGDAIGPGGRQPVAGDAAVGARTGHVPEHGHGRLRTTAGRGLHRGPGRLGQLYRRVAAARAASGAAGG